MSDSNLPRLRLLAPVGIAALLLLGHAIYTPLTLFAALPKPVIGQPGQGVDYVRSLRDSEALAEAIQGRAEIGYVSERPVDPSGGGLGELRFYLAQFALAPVLLADRVPHPLVLANFEDPNALRVFLLRVRGRVLVEVAPGRALVGMGAQ